MYTMNSLTHAFPPVTQEPNEEDVIITISDEEDEDIIITIPGKYKYYIHLI